MGKKWERCVRKVKSKIKRTGYKGNPYAICTAKVGRLNARKGMGKGMGCGYKNLVPKDPYIHGLSAKGIKTARELIKMEYRTSKNFMTPHVIKVGKSKGDRAFELSSGEGIEAGTKLFGVSVVDYNPESDTTKRRTDLSKSFHSKQEAEDYIRQLKNLNAKERRYLSNKLLAELDDLYGHNIPSYLDVINKNKIKIKVSDWEGEKWVDITPEDVIEYYDTQARNIVSGVRTIAGHSGDWRNIDALAKESLEIFKIINRPALEKIGKEHGMTLKAKGKRDFMRSVVRFEEMNPDYPSTQMEGVSIEIKKPKNWQDEGYIDEKVENTKSFYNSILNNFGNRIKHPNIQKEFKKKLSQHKLDAKKVKR